jgi:hypothetical protein
MQAASDNIPADQQQLTTFLLKAAQDLRSDGT